MTPERAGIFIDHVAPAANVATADAQVLARRFAQEEGITHVYDVGRGVCHQVMIEERLVRPGEIAIGSDSHSNSYGAIGAFGTGMGASDIALAWASGRTWLRVPETIRVGARGRFRPRVGAKDLSLHVAAAIGADGALCGAGIPGSGSPAPGRSPDPALHEHRGRPYPAVGRGGPGRTYDCGARFEPGAGPRRSR